ncbi:hypothetical protein EON73_01750 [bacterium]|nr:MAG: hypothetical protein EON73_01750 [bacterium]
MLQRIHDSFAFRFPVLFYRNWLNFIKPPRPKDKPLAPFNYAVLCGKKHYQFLKQEFLSVQKQFTELPFAYVYLDFGFPDKHIKDIYSLYPASKLKVITAVDCLRYHQIKGNNILVNVAKMNPMVLKLAAVLQTVDLNIPLIYADTDILWLQDPIESIKTLIKGPLNMHMQYDYQPGYDFNLIDKTALTCLYEQPYYCAGLMLIKFLNNEQLATIYRMLPILAESSGHLSEQTIFAYLQKTIGASELTPDKYILNYADQFKISFTVKKQWIARHYIGPVRHLFWRDAFYN